MALKRERTSSSGFTSVCALTHSSMFPFFIHSDAITNWFMVIVTPNSGSTFGWRRDLHATTSLQNFYRHSQSPIHMTSRGKPTFVTLARSLVGYTLKTLAATSLPSCWPFHTSPNSSWCIGFPFGL